MQLKQLNPKPKSLNSLKSLNLNPKCTAWMLGDRAGDEG